MLIRLIFYLFSTLTSFVLGIYVAGWLGAGKGQMLAAGAIVIGWGFLAALFGLISSILLARQLAIRQLVRLNWTLFALLIALYAITHYRYVQRQKIKEMEASLVLEQMPALQVNNHIEKSEVGKEIPIGLGFFQPNFYEYPALYFYGRVNLEKSIVEHLPADSLVFAQTELGFQTSYAPPWLYPAHLKLDYGIIFFKVLGVGHDLLKVETNQATRQYHYLDKSKGRFIPWPEMLLSVSSIEPIDKKVSPIHIKPLAHAEQLNLPYDFLQPLLVENDWVYVKLVDTQLREKGKGWIRWRNCNQLLVSYSIFS